MHKFYNHNSLDPFPLEKGSVNLVCTSPPYFALRNYRDDPRQIGAEKLPDCGGRLGIELCGECYVCHIVQVGRNLREALAEDGSWYLNIGDSYFNKSLALVPHRTAIALQQDGWIQRNTIVWSKPAPMPTSVKDRLNTSHEYVFHFTKNEHYYYNLDAIRQPHQTLTADKYMTAGTSLDEFKKELENKGVMVGAINKEDEMLGLVADEFTEYTHDNTYDTTKAEGEETINVGARGGFVKLGETMQNRYADGGKNPGDVFIEERKFTLEDELQAEREYGYTRHAAARVTARLKIKGMVKNHPLGKNPGDVHINSDTGVTDERVSDMWWADGIETECPECGLQFETQLNEIYTDNPTDIWRVNTEGNDLKHFAVWPKELVRRMIKSSSRPGDNVLDPFAGSGTTVAIAEECGRNGLGFDLSYGDVQEKRMNRGVEQDGISTGLFIVEEQ